MSRTLSPAAFRSTDSPDGYSRGRRVVEEPELPIITDTVGPALFIPEPRPEVEDRLTRLADAIESLESHPLVRQFGFPADALITDVDGNHPVVMGFEVLSVTLAACQAANELATLTDDREVAKVLGWTGEMPKQIKHFGADRLFRHAGALQARIAEIREERARHKSRIKRDVSPPQALSLSKGTTPKVGGIRPRPIQTPRPTTQETPMNAPRPVAAARTTVAPAAPALRQRIRIGMAEAEQLNSHGARQLLQQARSVRTHEHAEKLVQQAERMILNCEDKPLPTPAPTTPKPACFGDGTSTTTASKKAQQLARKRAKTAEFTCPKGASNGGGAPQGKQGGKKGKSSKKK